MLQDATVNNNDLEKNQIASANRMLMNYLHIFMKHAKTNL